MSKSGTKIDRLNDLDKHFKFFHDKDETPYGIVKQSGQFIALKLDSSQFGNKIRRYFFSEFEDVLSDSL